MDCFVKSHVEKEAIYEIYRSCRLCGGGAGYKMPIIQNVVNISTGDVELKDKIRECVQIEISQDDKMPPLICELCVDKIQDFYDFLEMCRRTNKRTRLRLGLPPQALVRDVPEAGDCILGITEPVYIKKETNTKKKGKVIEKGKDVKVKKEPEKGVKVKKVVIQVKQEKTKFLNRELQQLLKSSKSEEIEAELLRRGNRNLDKKQEKVQKAKAVSELEPKSILKKKDNTSSSVTLKRTRDKEVKRKSDVQTKKVKIVETPSPRMTRTSSVMINDDDGDGDEAIDQGKAPCRICRRKYHIGAPMTNHIMR
ncbi:uncharacterized protein LOC119838448, partial [Zerene cesonia]|uniref:uncharacterized protein LOC119838448 n=1 Tax=Zerene cesonia TaxID=33412 RepID=UPI0018E4E802